jgi:hypothetical protein
MHMTWMERVRNRPQKPVKNEQKGVKNGKKTLARLARLTIGTPSAEKSPRTPVPGPMGFQKRPKNFPQNFLQKVIHNRRLPVSRACV